MKLVKNLVLTMALASVLAVNVFAGEQPIMGSPAPAPSPSPGATTASSEGTVVYDPTSESTETSDYLFFEALAALLSMY